MKIAVIGSGAWGTALAIRLHKNGNEVVMWTFEKDLIPEMESTRRNPRLPNALLPEGLAISSDYACARGCQMVVIASPSAPMRSVCRGVAPFIDEDAVVVSVTKGIELGTQLRMSPGNRQGSCRPHRPQPRRRSGRRHSHWLAVRLPQPGSG